VRERGVAVMDLLGLRQLPMELPMHNARPLHRRVLSHGIVFGLTLVACDPAKLGTLDAEATGSTGDDPSETASDDAGSQTGPATSSTTSGPSSDDGATSSSDGGGTFPDVGDGATTTSDADPSGDPTGIDGEACDIWVQDCPDGEKCNPWSNDGGTVWNADGCFPVDPDPVQLGDECLVEGSGTSGIDNCAIGSMCWNADPESNTGTCIALCGGSPDDPLCSSPTTCAILNDGVLPVCLPVCDPLLQDCDEGLGCYPVAQEFVCVPDVSGESGLYLEPCNFPGDCDPGNACVSADAVAGCESAGCCTAYCDISLISPGCPDASECLAFFEEGFAPPGLENVGLCS